MVGAVSSSTLAVPTSTAKLTDPSAIQSVKGADQALNLLLQDSTLIESLTQQSARWVPVTQGKIMATLWGLLNPNSGSMLSKQNVRLAVYSEGGGTALGDALWAQLSPDGKDTIDAGTFATNSYLSSAVTANLDSVQQAVEARRLKDSALQSLGGSGTILDSFVGFGGSGTILDLFA